MKRVLLAFILALVPALASAQSPSPYTALPTQPLAPAIVVFPGSASQVLAVDGTSSAPSMSFAADPGTGFRRSGFGVLVFDSGGVDAMALGGNATGLTMHALSPIQWGSAALGSADLTLSRGGAGKLTLTGTTPMLQLGGTTASFPALRQESTTQLGVVLADASAYAVLRAAGYSATGGILFSGTAPTLGTCTGFGTGPAIGTTNSTASFLVTVGTAPPLSGACTITLPTATTGWNCAGEFRTSAATMKETSTTTTTAVLTVAGTPTAGETAQLRCAAY